MPEAVNHCEGWIELEKCPMAFNLVRKNGMILEVLLNKRIPKGVQMSS